MSTVIDTNHSQYELVLMRDGGKGRRASKSSEASNSGASLFHRKALSLSGPEDVMALGDNPSHLKLMAAALMRERARRCGGRRTGNGACSGVAAALECPEDVMNLDDDCVKLKALLIDLVYQLAFEKERRREAEKRKAEAKRQPSLTENLIRKLPPGRHYDNQGHGLFVSVSGTKKRRRYGQRLHVEGMSGRTDVSIGRCDLIDLTDARAKAIKNLALAADGIHPGGRHAQRKVPTLADMVDEFIESERSNWEGVNTEQEYRRLCEKHVLGSLGSKRVDRISVDDLAPVIEPIWKGRGSSGYRVLQLLGRIFDRVKARRWRSDNPAKDVRPLMPKTKKRDRHHDAVPHPEVPDAITQIRDFVAFSPNRSLSDPAVALALELQVLTACRPGEALNACWNEFDLESRTWTIPPERMKTRARHRVPLSDQATDVLRRARELGTGDEGVFVYRGRDRGLRAPLVNAMNKLVRRLGLPGTAHGFRSSFRDWATEIAEADFQVAELALAHVQPDRTVGAYARSDLLERRRPLMQRWADHVMPQLEEEVPSTN